MLLKIISRTFKLIKDAKKMGVSDKYIGMLWGMSESDVFKLRKENNIFPIYNEIETCAF